jgi:hypothetical protein
MQMNRQATEQSATIEKQRTSPAQLAGRCCLARHSRRLHGLVGESLRTARERRWTETAARSPRTRRANQSTRRGRIAKRTTRDTDSTRRVALAPRRRSTAHAAEQRNPGEYKKSNVKSGGGRVWGDGGKRKGEETLGEGGVECVFWGWGWRGDEN